MCTHQEQEADCVSLSYSIRPKTHRNMLLTSKPQSTSGSTRLWAKGHQMCVTANRDGGKTHDPWYTVTHTHTHTLTHTHTHKHTHNQVSVWNPRVQDCRPHAVRSRGMQLNPPPPTEWRCVLPGSTAKAVPVQILHIEKNTTVMWPVPHWLHKGGVSWTKPMAGPERCTLLSPWFNIHNQEPRIVQNQNIPPVGGTTASPLSLRDEAKWYKDIPGVFWQEETIPQKESEIGGHSYCILVSVKLFNKAHNKLKRWGTILSLLYFMWLCVFSDCQWLRCVFSPDAQGFTDFVPITMNPI